MKDRIIAYLAQGFQPSKVASMCGCSEAMISQVARDCAEEIAEEAKKLQEKEKDHALEQTYMKLESKILKAVEEQLPYAEFADLTKAMTAMIQRRQKPAPIPAGITFDNRQQFVLLQIPAAAVPELTLNSRKEVIAVDGQALAALPSPAVRTLFGRIETLRAEREAHRVIEHAAQAKKDIPLPVEEEILIPAHMPDDF